MATEPGGGATVVRFPRECCVVVVVVVAAEEAALAVDFFFFLPPVEVVVAAAAEEAICSVREFPPPLPPVVLSPPAERRGLVLLPPDSSPSTLASASEAASASRCRAMATAVAGLDDGLPLLAEDLPRDDRRLLVGVVVDILLPVCLFAASQQKGIFASSKTAAKPSENKIPTVLVSLPVAPIFWE